MATTKTWKTVETGALPKQELLRQCEEVGYVSSLAKELIEKMPEEGLEKISLVKMTLAEMGFTKPAKWHEILARVRELGDVCPPEVGPLLRIDDTKQPKGSWYYIAMEPITGSDGRPLVFCVMRYGDGESWLRADWVRPDHEWYLDGEVVFRLRKEHSDTQNSSPETLRTLPSELIIDGQLYRRV